MPTLLVLGGTGFIGPHMVQEALKRGYEVTVFNRGKNKDKIPEGVKHLEGDRQQSLAPLAGMRFDAVIDNCGYLPRHVQRSVDALRGSVGRYVFISSISAYQASRLPLHEDDAVAVLPEGAKEVVDWQTYGPYKALCEQEVMDGFAHAHPDDADPAGEAKKSAAGSDGARTGREQDSLATIIRPGLIVGPGDPTDRFTYWPVRVAEAAAKREAFLCPGSPSDPIQVIDVRDLAAFTLTLIERGLGGIYNASGPLPAISMGELASALQDLTGHQATPQWVDSGRLAAMEVQPWGDMPAWIPMDSDEIGMSMVSLAKSQAAGLTCRPIAQTLTDTLAWFRSLPTERQSLKAGISRARELEVLARAHE